MGLYGKYEINRKVKGYVYQICNNIQTNVGNIVKSHINRAHISSIIPFWHDLATYWFCIFSVIYENVENL